MLVDTLQDNILAFGKYLNILQALSHFKSPLKNLTLDSMPQELPLMLIERDEVATNLSVSLANIQDLCIGVVMGRTTDIKSRVTTLQHSFGYIPNLRWLNMTWDTHQSVGISLEWYELFRKFSLHKLESLCIRDSSNPAESMMEFFVGFSQSLKRLSLFGRKFGHYNIESQTHEWDTNSFSDNAKTFLGQLRGQLALEKLEIGVRCRQLRHLHSSFGKPYTRHLLIPRIPHGHFKEYARTQ
jgi:hypothetical protein